MMIRLSASAILMIFSALFMNAKLNAQSVSVIPWISMNANTMNISGNGENDQLLDHQTYLFRPSGGIDLDIALSEKFSVRPGVHIARRGTKFSNFGFESLEGLDDISDEPGGGDADDPFGGGDDFMSAGVSADLTMRTKLTYLHFPLNFNYRAEIGEDLYINLNAGPYLGVALSGVMTVEGEVNAFFFNVPVDEEEELHIEEDIKRIDYGANFNAGLEISNFMINLGYGLGFADISGTNPMVNNDEIKNRFITLGVGYRIGF